MGSHGEPWGAMGSDGERWGAMGSHGEPWVAMGSDGERWGAMGSDGERWGAMGSDGERWGAMGSDGEPWGAADEAPLACPPLTSCCAAGFLTDCRPLPVGGLGLGTPGLGQCDGPVTGGRWGLQLRGQARPRWR